MLKFTKRLNTPNEWQAFSTNHSGLAFAQKGAEFIIPALNALQGLRRRKVRNWLLSESFNRVKDLNFLLMRHCSKILGDFW
jgi:hypothetical protein